VGLTGRSFTIGWWLVRSFKPGDEAVTDYKKMKKWELVRLLENLEAQNKAALRQTWKVDFAGRRDVECIALPLTWEEKNAVERYIRDMISDVAGEGEIINEFPNFSDDPENVKKTYEIALPWKWSVEPILPKYAGLVARYEYSRNDGTFVTEVWGLVPVKESK
jgi:hypothetical protein